MVMLKIENLSKDYILKGKSVSANRNINFSVDFGKFIWIRGNSGAGKTTLLNLISGIDEPDTGKIFWNEKEITSMSKNERSEFRAFSCGLVFQFFELLKTQSAFYNASLPMEIAGKSKGEIKNRITELFEEFGLGALASKKPRELSGGERQRVAICRAIANKPTLLLADEITASLDTELSKKVYSYLKNYIKEKNAVGIFVSHDELIKDYADEIYEMKSGELSLWG